MAEFLDIEVLLARSRAHDHPVSVRDGGVLDFGTLSVRAGQWCARIASHDARRIALHLEDGFEFAAALLGAWHAGRCVVLPADVRPATVDRLRQHAGAFIGDFPDDVAPLVLDRATGASAPAPNFAPLDPQAVSLVLFTSGSSGEPVAIEKRLGQLSAELRTLASTWDPRLGDARVLATVSHQHIYGLLHRVLWPLTSGRPFAARRVVYPEDLVAALGDGEASLIASPAHLKRLPRGLDWAPVRPALRAVFSSGGPLPIEALRECRELLGQAPLEVYGSSETGGVAWRQRTDDDACAWRAFEGVSLRFDDAGTLEVRSALLPDEGWLKTADRARPVDGGFELLGREDRLIKIEEKRISLTGLERALVAGELVTEARVVPLPGRRVVLGVVAIPTIAGRALLASGGRRALNEALRTQLAASVERIALPRRFRFVDALPVNAQGKTTEAQLVDLFDPRRPPARVLEKERAHARVALDVQADCPFFEGHFPDQPILPGVAQVEWVVRVARELFDMGPDFLGLEALKFQQVIRPGTELELSLDWSEEKGRLAFRYTSSSGPHAHGRILFGEVAR